MTEHSDLALKQAMEQCASEPIHKLGTIQPHGVAIVLNTNPVNSIIQASKNLAELLKISAEEALDQPLHSVLGASAAAQVSQLINTAQLSNSNTAIGSIDFVNSTFNKLDAHVYLSDGFPVLELTNDSDLETSENLTELLSQIQELLPEDDDGKKHLHDYFQQVAETVRSILAYDNVMIYKFDEYWDGEVIAQSRIEKVTDYLGLHFPASDIPEQARKLYTTNLVRGVADINATPISIIPELNPVSNAALDMSFSALRSLSPIHITYLRNMGVTATLSISLLQNGKLWGLIACHHLTPKRISLPMRKAAHLISKLVSLKLAMKGLIKHQRLTHKALDVNLKTIAKLSKLSAIDTSKTLPELMNLFNATGIIVVVDNIRFLAGITPSQNDITDLLNWLNPTMGDEPYVCNELSKSYSEAEAYTDKVAGLLAIRHTNNMENCILWLRQEKIRKINWAGSNNEGLTQTNDQYHLTPRKSFESWSETSRGRCEPWPKEKIKFAHFFQASLSTFLHSLHLENLLNDTQHSHIELLNAVPTGIIITDPFKRITFANKDFEQLTGYSQQEILGKNCKILHGPETNPDHIQAIRDSLTEQQSFIGEILNYRKDGTSFWNELTISPIYDKQNQLSHYVGIQRDISEHKLMKDNLVESEKRFRELSDVTPALIWQADVHKNLFWFNKSWLKFTGRSYFIEQGTGWVKGIHPQDRDAFMSNYNRLFDRREHFHIEFRLQRADGKYRWLDGHYVPQQSADGEFIGYVGTCIDITDLRNSKAALDFFNVAHEIIYSTDLNRIVLDCNQRFCELTGYSRDEVVGQNISILKSGMHDTSFYAHMWQKLNTESFWQGEFINRTKAGDLTTIMTTISVIFDSRGKPQRYLAVGSDITDIINKRQHYEQIAYYDNLTGLPNRLLLLDRLENAISRTKRYGGFFAVIFIDLDGFKAINDHYGHAIGDKFLVAISHQIKLTIRDSDTLARLGGDEFIVILDGLTTKHDHEGPIISLLKVCNSDILLEGVALKVSASIGACLYPNDIIAEDADAKTLLSHADQAMYVAKNQGKNCFHFFDSTQDQAIITRNNAIDAIKKGLEQREFELLYQPKVNMRSGEVLGFEALIRWNKDTGQIGPALFLPIVQNHPLGIELGNWVIDSALTQLSKWNEQGIETSISINVDPRQLYQTNFVDKLQNAINRQSNYRAGSLELEILETTALDDRLSVCSIINSCRDMGIEFALDDFGTGYSSITYLKELPIKSLKIDRSFIIDMTESEKNLKLVENIINLTLGMEKQVIAEGVETVEQGEILLSLGCEYAQGFAIAKPMTATKLATWIKEWKPYPSWSIATSSIFDYQHLFEGMTDPIMIIKNDRFIECNEATLKILGYPSKENFINKHPSEVSPTLQPDGCLSNEKAKAMNEIAKQNGYHCFEWTHLRFDGSELLVEVMLTKTQLNNEEFIQVVWRDLSLRG